MKAKRLIYIIVVFIIVGVVVFLSCKKDDSDDSTIATVTLDEAKQSESQDAIADKIEQDLDNNIDKLEQNNFKVSSAKSAYDDCIDISIDSASVTGWPKTVTLTYNCTDTVNGEKISQTGTISVVVEVIGQSLAGKLLRKSITFSNYKVETDSAAFTINGTRTVTRQSAKTTILSKDLKAARLDIEDSIVSNLTFDVKYANALISFTRNVNHLRNSILYFKRVFLFWYPEIKNDTVTLSGSVKGLNAANITYTRQITTPLEFTFCPLWPHNLIIAKGGIDFNNAKGKVGTISYSASGCKTSVTLTVNGKTKQIERKIGLGYLKWW